MTSLPGGKPSPIPVPENGIELADIVLIGVNHRTAPVELREKLAFSADETTEALASLRQSAHVEEAILISTCNRVEFLLTSRDREAAAGAVTAFIAKSKSIAPAKLTPSMYVHSGESAVRHLYRVAASLDSMMIGEPQILGQVKDAYKNAVDRKSAGVILNRLLHKAFAVAKRVRSETGIGGHAVSISYAAVELAKKIFDDLNGKTVLLVGAGEMAELAVEHLVRNRTRGHILVANRTFSVGLELARRFNGEAVRLEEIGEKLVVADIIISSTGAPGYVISKNDVRPIMRTRKNRPLFFIDIAVPRDIDPEINRISNAYVYDIDDLQGVITENIEARMKESIKAERIVDEAVITFFQWYHNLQVVPTIVALREKFDALADTELSRTLQSMELAEKDREALSKMMHATINKILHDPTIFLKHPGSHRSKSVYIDFIRNLFKLDE